MMVEIYRLSRSRWKKIRHGYVEEEPGYAEMEKALVFINTKLETYGVDFVYSAGTCLGMYRDKTFIKGDDDIDIDMSIEDYKRIIEKLLNGLKEENIPFRIGEFYDYPKVSIFYMSVKISMVAQLFDKRSEMFFRNKYQVPSNLLMPSKKWKWKGRSIRLPNKPEEYLKYVYGENWCTPVKWTDEDNYNSLYAVERKRSTRIGTIMSKFKSYLNNFSRQHMGIYYIFLP